MPNGNERMARCDKSFMVKLIWKKCVKNWMGGGGVKPVFGTTF